MKHLPGPSLCQRFVECPDLLDVAEGVTVLLELEDHIHPPAVIERLQHAHDVWVPQVRPQLQFPRQEFRLKVRGSAIPAREG